MLQRGGKSGFRIVVDYMIATVIMGILLVVAGILGIMLANAITNYFAALDTSQRKICIANLKQIDAAKARWAMDHRKGSGAVPVWKDIVGPDGYIKKMLACPCGEYKLNSVAVDPECSYGYGGQGDSDDHVLP